MRSPSEWAALVQSVLTVDLLKPSYQAKWTPRNPTFGHCYAASEACWYLIGGKAAGWKPMCSHGGNTHWWLQHESGERLDPTADQFVSQGLVPPYHDGRGCGFLTKRPSKRAVEIIRRVEQLM